MDTNRRITVINFMHSQTAIKVSQEILFVFLGNKEKELWRNYLFKKRCLWKIYNFRKNEGLNLLLGAIRGIFSVYPMTLIGLSFAFFIVMAGFLFKFGREKIYFYKTGNFSFK